MSLSPARNEVLEALLLHKKAVKAIQIAQETAKDQPAVQMHLIGLVRMGYAETPQKGYYIISEKGKTVLGLLTTTRENAISILKQTNQEKAFHFYDDIGKPLNIYARDLQEFCDKIDQANLNSVEFHLNRGDFEAWFKSLGDKELAKKILLLKNIKLSGEQLRERIHEIVDNRRMELSQLVGQTSTLT